MKASIPEFVRDYAALLAAIDFNVAAAARYQGLFSAAGKGTEMNALREHYQHMCEHHSIQVFQLREFEKLFIAVMEGGITSAWNNTTIRQEISQPRH